MEPGIGKAAAHGSNIDGQQGKRISCTLYSLSSSELVVVALVQHSTNIPTASYISPRLKQHLLTPVASSDGKQPSIVHGLVTGGTLRGPSGDPQGTLATLRALLEQGRNDAEPING